MDNTHYISSYTKSDTHGMFWSECVQTTQGENTADFELLARPFTNLATRSIPMEDWNLYCIATLYSFTISFINSSPSSGLTMQLLLSTRYDFLYIILTLAYVLEKTRVKTSDFKFSTRFCTLE